MMDKFGDIQRKYLMHCWGVQGNYQPIPVEKTEGCWIYTKDGRRILDLRSAHECINLGFQHPDVLQAMQEQMEKVVYVTDDFATEPTAKLAQKLAEITPGSPDKRVWFGQSGAAAVEAAIRGARLFSYHKMMKRGSENLSPSMQYPYPYKIISRYRSWHGATAGAISVSGDPRRRFQEPLVTPGISYAPDAYCYRCMLGHEFPGCNLACVDYLDQMIEMEGGSNKVAAVILEPIVGSNGIILPPPGYLPRVREICDKWDVLLILDETMTGFGRTGEMFAMNHYNVIPDITVVGKAFGVYCPLTAAIFSNSVTQAFDENVFGHGQSYSGHALACAAALGSLKVLEEQNLVEKAKEMGKYLGERLNEIGQQHPSVGDVRGIGLFWTMELVKNRETKEPLRRPTEKYKETVVRKIAQYMLNERNIYIPSDKFGIWIVPPLVINREEIDFLLDAIDDALDMSDAEVR